MALLQDAGVFIAGKAGTLHGGCDLPAGLFADVGVVVEDAGNRSHTVARLPRQILYGHPLTAPAATPLMMCFWQNRYTTMMGRMLMKMMAMKAPISTEP